jgi:CheY-like chemotaxis protein
VQSTLLRKANILAVDDQRANLVALDAVLGRDNHMIFASSGPEAIEVLRARSDIDVILMDLQMPGMDGFEAASLIKQIAGCEDIPVVFITAVYNEDPYVKQGYKVGAVDYFSKPFDAEILRLKVGIYASFRQKADLLRERERQLKASEGLREVAHKLWALLDTLRVGVIMTDKNGRVCRTNSEVHSLCKSPNPPSDFSIQSLGWWDASGNLVDGELAALTAALEAGESSHNEVIEVKCVNGSSKTVLCSASPVHDLAGEVAGAVLVFQDLADRQAVGRDLEHQIARLASSPRTELQAGD